MLCSSSSGDLSQWWDDGLKYRWYDPQVETDVLEQSQVFFT